MDQPSKYSLFFLAENPYFEEGTLFELEDKLVSGASLDPTSEQPFNTVPVGDYKVFGYRLPDRGNGIPGFISEDDVVRCPPFAENVPPGNCPVKVTYQRVLSDADNSYDTNPNNIGIFNIYVDQNLHWQKLVITLPDKFPDIERVTLTNTLKDVEVDSYETPSLEQTESGPAYCLHLGYVGPGFYQMDMRLGRGRYLRIRLIKLFPRDFNERYETLTPQEPAAVTATRPVESMLASLFHTLRGDSQYEFPVEMMNHALELTTEWGENFRKPIDDRMRSRYPELTSEEIVRLKALADEAESYILNLAEREMNGEINELDIVPMAKQKYPWVYKGQLSRIINIGMYWARK